MLRDKHIYFAIRVIFLFQIKQIFCDEYKVIETNYGAVRGIKSTTWWNDVPYYSFKGIPYAQSPTGELRFKPPKPMEPWAPEIRDAFEFGDRCPQSDNYLPNLDPKSENCLFLNVYVPGDMKPGEKLPVIVFIYGGGFQDGASNIYGANFLIEHRVIVITLNYRIGIFGFLSLKSLGYSGNMGLKDQLLALKWVHENIGAFGGDNDQITLMGQSAGSASAHLHILTDGSKYFKNAILLSATAFNFWAMSENNDQSETAYKLCEQMGKPASNDDELLKNLLSASEEDLVEYSSELSAFNKTLKFLFTPVIEPSDVEGAFINQPIEEIYEKRVFDKNVVFSSTSAEMQTFAGRDAPDLLDIESLNDNFNLQLPFRNHNLDTKSKDFREIMDLLRQYYFKNDIIDDDKKIEYNSLLSDLNFVYHIDKTAKLHASKSTGKTFYLKFSVDSSLNLIKKLRSKIKVPGAAHAEDLVYLFNIRPASLLYSLVHYSRFRQQSRISVSTIDRMTNLITDFAKIDLTGCSTCSDLKFNPIQNGTINFLNITNDGFEVGLDPNRESMELWANIEKRMQKFISKN